MKRLSKVCAILVVLMLVVSYTTLVSAFSATATLTSSATLKAGETVTVNVNLGNLDVGSGVDAIVATLDYDENVFEAITQNNIAGKDSWTINAYSTSTKKFTATRSSKYTTAGTIATISFKVKSGITATSSTITLKNMEISGGAVSDGGTGDIALNNATITLKANSEPTTSTEKPTQKPSTSTGTTNSTNTTNKNTANKVDNTTIKTSALPKTGLEQAGIIAIVVIAIVGIFSYVLYKKTSKEVK